MFYVPVVFQSSLFEVFGSAAGCRMVRRAAWPPSGGWRRRRAAMAKGQMKSNKEVRKPKAEKPKPSVTVSSSSPFTTPPGKK
jgi:hypothetical protein